MLLKPFFSSLLNAVSLTIFGIWGFFSVPNSSITALIPVFGASIIFVLLPALKSENRKAAHAIVLITLLLLIGLIKPLLGSIERGNAMAIYRVVTMMLTSIYAMVTYIKSFIDVRRKR